MLAARNFFISKAARRRLSGKLLRWSSSWYSARIGSEAYNLTRPDKRQFQNPKRRAVFVEVGRDDDVRIQDNPDHLPGWLTALFCRRSRRTAAISASICSMVSSFKAFCLASAPMAFSQAGVGAKVSM